MLLKKADTTLDDAILESAKRCARIDIASGPLPLNQSCFFRRPKTFFNSIDPNTTFGSSGSNVRLVKSGGLPMIKIGFQVFTGFILLTATLLVGGFTYEQIKLARDRERYPSPGRLVDIGGRRLHLLCKGSANGPTVVMETGAGDGSYRF